MGDSQPPDHVLQIRKDEKVQKPSKFRVVILNDDYTPIDFVVELLSRVFRKSIEEAAALTLSVHNSGSAVAGVYTYEVAETLKQQADTLSREAGHPLQMILERDS